MPFSSTEMSFSKFRSKMKPKAKKIILSEQTDWFYWKLKMAILQFVSFYQFFWHEKSSQECGQQIWHRFWDIDLRSLTLSGRGVAWYSGLHHCLPPRSPRVWIPPPPWIINIFSMYHFSWFIYILLLTWRRSDRNDEKKVTMN